MGTTVLVVEDDPAIQELIRFTLQKAGLKPVAAPSAEAAQAALNAELPDVVLIDWMLPKMSGLALARELRAAPRTAKLPLIMVTARGEEGDRVAGLESGADDYLVKPFAFSELLARVRTLLRRGKAKEPEALRAADLELDLLRRRVSRAGRRIDLTAKEFALLELLLRRQGEVLPRSLIASQVWDMNFDSDTNVIEVAVRRLRAKVDDDFEPKLIRTVRGMGYVLEIPEAA